MFHRVAITAVLTVPLICAPARADGLLQHLPQDGAWALYDMETTMERPNGSKKMSTGYLKVSSVGKTSENGQPCRWIEVEQTWKNDPSGAEGKEIFKLLVPEKLAVGQSL